MSQRQSQDKVYSQIILDLKESTELLKENYVSGPDLSVTTERTRVNKSTAQALLARAYLYSGDYQNAEALATKVIDQKALYDTVGLSEVFLKNSKEAIFQLAKPTPNYENVNTHEGKGYILRARPTISGIQESSSITPRFYLGFEIGDKRKNVWIGTYEVSSTEHYYFPYKYKVKLSSNLTEYSTVIRLAEIYLIRSEARLYNGNSDGAISDLNVIRKRASLTDIRSKITINLESVLAAILQERRSELFTEWGHRWFDLKRTNKIDGVMQEVSKDKNSTWNVNAKLWPIPIYEIEANPSLKQNPGYQ